MGHCKSSQKNKISSYGTADRTDIRKEMTRLRRSHDVRVAGITDPGYAFTIRLTAHYGRGRGRTAGRGLGDGLGEELSQLGAHKLPSL